MAKVKFKENKQEATKKAKKSKRRRSAKKAWGIFISFLLICIAALCILSVTVFFKTAEIKVTGSTIYSYEEIFDVCGIDLGDNLFLISKDKVSSRIEEKLPFVKKAKVEIQLPETVIIKVTEAREEVCFKTSKNIYSADFDSKILKKYKSIPEDLIVVSVSDKTKLNIGKNAKFASDLEAKLINKYFALINDYGFDVNSINVLDPYNTEMKVDNQFIVKFGSSSEIDSKAAHLNAMLKKMDDNQSGVIDLSVWSEDKHEAYFTEQSISEYEG